MNEKSYVMYYSTDEKKLKAERILAGKKFSDEKEWNEFGSYSYDLTGPGIKKFKNYKAAIVDVGLEKTSEKLSSTLYTSPYYRTIDGHEIGITQLFFVKFKSDTDLTQLEKLAQENAVEMMGPDKFHPGWYMLACTNLSKGNSLEMANLFYDSGLFVESSPDFILEIKFDCINEPRFADGTLWHLYNKSYPGIDIKYCDARAIQSMGSSNVTVAIIDGGVQTNHPDLYNVLPGWDADTRTAPGIVYNYHGTAVAGFIGAIPNNNTGVAGIAYGVKILPISFKSSTTVAYLQYAFDHAVNNGAKVINCSWHLSSNSPVVNEGIRNALDKDCIIVFCAGNEGTNSIGYPQSIDPRTIVVGGISQNGRRAIDSNYGAALDLVAPSENVYTTSSEGGYVYTLGTSFAAPQVAAVAALLLSAKSGLTQKEVTYLIERTANKSLPGYTFNTTRDNGSWNNEVGYGLLNAHAALALATAAPTGNPYIEIQSTPVLTESGYAGTTLHAYPSNSSYTYFWSGTFYGSCDRWYIWPSNNGIGPNADISIYLNPGQTGGTLSVSCKVYNGTTYIGTATKSVYVNR